MALIEGWLPPSRENWEFVNFWWQFFPLFSLAQLFTTWYPMGKTSVESKLNIPGKIGWATMEAPGFIILLYIISTLPHDLGVQALPWTNWTMAGMFTTHYLYRALLAPLVLNPSMAPIHLFVWFGALSWQVVTAISLGGWLGGYGPITDHEWAGRRYMIVSGFVLWVIGLLSNAYHDDVLREIRRAAMRKEKQAAGRGSKGGQSSATKLYEIPSAGLFRFILYPHYFCEWLEWIGFWMFGGVNCVPAKSFVLNEVAAMLPRALNGRQWYIQKFGADKIGNKKAVIPGLL